MAEKICSIRTDEETLANFKELCKQFDNQSECLQALINLHELSNSKKVLSGQQSSIDDFQSRGEGRSVDNCAEIWSVWDAILQGTKYDNIALRTISIWGGSYTPPCRNCQHTFNTLFTFDD